MPIDAHHRLILISLRIYVEHLIYTLLNNQNVSLCSQKSVELIKEWRYIYIYIYAIVNSEDAFVESIIQFKMYVTWYTFKTQV